MPAKKGTKGELLQYDEPDWLPLALVSGIDLLEDFMWMHIPLIQALRGVLHPLWGDLNSAPGAPERARRAIDLVFSREEGADTISRR